MLRKLYFYPLALLALIAAIGITTAAFADDTTTLNLSLSGLEDLGPDYAYEGWLIVDGSPVSTGVFNISADGTADLNNVAIDQDVADNAAAFVLTIEPSPDPDPAPASTHVLAGEFANGTAALGTAHPAALGTDFSDATGSYILAVPSAAEGTASYYNGIWFLDPAAGPGAGLDLPTLPEGWAYEGWVVGENGPISTGTFTDVAAADSDGGGATAGPNPTPPFPGQDFVNPLTDLRGYTVVISVEPVPDNSPAPFAIKPLIDVTVDDTTAPGRPQNFQASKGAGVSGVAAFSTAAAPAAPSQPAPSAPAAPAPAAPAAPSTGVAVFNTPVGSEGPGPAFPGDAYEWTFTANHGESLHFATMLVQSNDRFFAPNEWGIALYDADGNAKSGDITDYVHLWDAGTELDGEPGVGPYQAPRQPAANSGPADTDTRVRRAHDDYGITPSVNQLIHVTLTHNGADSFTVRIDNISGSSALAGPLAPGVALATSDYAPLFQNQFPDRGMGLEALAEDGNAAILAGNLMK